jgi:hypothetical protein
MIVLYICVYILLGPVLKYYLFLNMTVFCDVALSNMVRITRRF